MLKNKPLVSIIIPIYNCESFISETIQSVLSQTYTNYEVHLVNDCSSDNSIQVVSSLIQDNPKFYLTHLKTHSGPAIARNTGIQLAKGRYIAFLDSDDLWQPQKLQEQVAFMLKHNHAFTYTDYTKIHEDGSSLNQLVHSPSPLTYKRMLRANFIGCSTVMYDQDLLGNITMPNLIKRQDYAMWLKLLKQTEFAYGLDKNLLKYRVRAHSVSSHKFELIKYNWLVFRKSEGFGPIKSVRHVSLNIIYKLFIKK